MALCCNYFRVSSLSIFWCSEPSCAFTFPFSIEHKDKLPLIWFIPTLQHHLFCFLIIILIHLLLFISFFSFCSCLPSSSWSFSNHSEAGALLSSLARNLFFLSQAPKLKGLHYPGRQGQRKTAQLPGACPGIKYIDPICKFG